MKIYNTYIFRELFKPFFLFVSVLLLLVWMTKLVIYSDYIVNNNSNIIEILKMTIFVLLPSSSLLFPLVLVLSIILVDVKCIESRELIIFKAYGLKKSEILIPSIIFAFFITVMTYTFTLYINPKSRILLEKTRNNVENNINFSLIKENIFSEFNGLILYSNYRDINEVRNFLIYKSLNKKKESLIVQTEKANIDVNNNIVLYNGNFQKFDSINNISEILFFEKYNFNYDNFIKKRSIRDKANIMTMKNLLNLFYESKNKNDSFSKKCFYEIVYRLMYPLTIPILSLLISSFILNEKFNRSESSMIFFKNGSISFIVFFIFTFLLKKIKASYLYFYILIIIMFLTLGISIYLLKERDI